MSLIERKSKRGLRLALNDLGLKGVVRLGTNRGRNLRGTRSNSVAEIALCV